MPKNFLRPAEIQECKEDRRALEKTLKYRDLDKRVQHSEIARSLRSIDKRMEQAAPELTPKTRDLAAKRVKTLEAEIKEGMLSQEEMRRNPPGAVAQNRVWEHQNKAKVLEWKNLNLAMMPGVSQEEASAHLNVARLRPIKSKLNMANAQIPVARTYSFPSEAYKEGHDRIFGEKNDEPDFIEALDEAESAEE